METFSASPVISLHIGQWRGDLMFSFICVWIYGWVNNRKAGDLKRYRAHFDINVMSNVTPQDMDNTEQFITQQNIAKIEQQAYARH